MTTGVAIVGASAIVGSSIALPPADVETTRVQLTTAESTAPTPNPLLAARVETSKRSTCEAVDARDDGWCAGTFPSLFTAVAGGLGIGLDIWDTTVGLGAAVVAGSAITAGLIGVGLDTALAEAFLTPLGLLVEGGVVPAQAASAITAMVEGLTTAANIGIAGVSTGIAWKAALDAALANAIAPAGADIINALIADFPNMDFTAALAALIGGLAAMGETALTWFDATVTLGSSVVAGMAITMATSAAEFHTALTGAFLECLEALSRSGVLPAPTATALAAQVESAFSAANAGILGFGSAIAWAAALPVVLAHAITTAGVGLIDGIAAQFPGVPDYPVIDLAALRAQLKANFPYFPLLPPLDFADLNPARFLAMLDAVFPNFPGVEFPNTELPCFPDRDGLTRLSVLLKGKVSVSSEDEEAGSTDEMKVAEGTLTDFSTHELPESVALPDDVLLEVPQSPKHVLAAEAKRELPSAAKHALPGEPDEAALVRTATSTPPKHGLEDSPKHELRGVPESDLKRSSSQSPETRSSESSQSSYSSKHGTSHKESNGASDGGSNGTSGSSE
jgi:hypothetical protein